MSFDYKNIKQIRISVNNGVWNAEMHNLVLTLDPKTKSGIIIKYEPIEPEIKNVDEAKEILKKFML